MAFHSMDNSQSMNRSTTSYDIYMSKQSFSILYSGGPSFRKMDVYVDGILVGTINQKAKRAAFQQRWDYPGQFELGAHTINIVFVGREGSSDFYGSLDAILVR